MNIMVAESEGSPQIPKTSLDMTRVSFVHLPLSWSIFVYYQQQQQQRPIITIMPLK